MKTITKKTQRMPMLRALAFTFIFLLISFSSKALEITLGNGETYIGNISSGALTVTVNSGNATFSGKITGNVTLVKKGAGELFLTGDNNYTGKTTVEQGILTVGKNTSSGAISNTVEVRSGAYLDFYRSNSYTYDGVISGAGRVNIYGKEYTFTKQQSYTGKTTVYSTAILKLTKDGNIQSSSEVELYSNAKLNISGISSTYTDVKKLTSSSSTTEVILGNKYLDVGHLTTGDLGIYAGKFSGAGKFRKYGPGSWKVTGTNTHTGGALIHQGTLEFDKLANFGSGLIEIGIGTPTIKWAAGNSADISSHFTGGIYGVTFDIGANNVTFASVLKNAGSTDITVTKKGTGNLYLTANNTFTGKMIVEQGWLYLGWATTTGSLTADIDLKSGASLRFWRTSNYTYNGVISGAGNVTLTNSVNATTFYTVTFTKAHTYTGYTSILKSTLKLSGSGSIKNSSGVTLQDPQSVFDISGVTGTTIDVKKLTSSQANAKVILGSKRLDVGYNTTGDLGTYAGKLSGDGKLYKYGSGALKFSGTQVNTNELNIIQGTLELASNWKGNIKLGFAGTTPYTSTLNIIGNRTIDGYFYTYASGSLRKIDFDLTVSPASKLNITSGIIPTGVTQLDVKCNKEGAYDLIIASGINSSAFSLNMTGTWKNGELRLDGTKLQLVKATDTTPPTISNKTVTASDITTNSVKLSWTKATDNTTSQANLAYQVTYTGGGETKTTIAQKNINTFTVTGLKDNTSYTFTVKVKDEAGNESSYTAVSATTKAAADTTPPTISNKTVTVNETSTNSVKLSWTKARDKTTSQANLAYQVTYTGGGETKTTIAQKNINTFTVTGLKDNTSYTFTVKVKDEAGNESSYTAVSATTKAAADTTPPDISNKTVTVNETSTNSVKLSWTKATDNTTSQANLAYQVTYTGGGETKTTIAQKNINTFTVTGLKDNTSYTFTVKVKDEAGNESSYDEVTATTLEASDTEAPTISNKEITVSEITDNSMTLSWEKAKDNKTDQVDLLYEVSYSDGEKTITLDAKKDIDSITLNDLKELTEYTINIKVSDEAGNESSYDEVTATTLEASDTEAPTISNKEITVSDITDNSMKLSWEKAMDNKTAQADLVYEVSYSDGEKTITLDAKKDIDSVTLSDLKADTEYTINIKVSDEAGNESSYDEVTATTLEASDTEAPTISNKEITVSEITDNSMTLSWEKAKDNKTDQVDLLYEVSYSDGEKTITLDAKKDIDSITLTDLKADTEYTINIKVSDEAGNESSYDEVTATTLEASDTEAPTISNKEITVSEITDNSMTLSWEKAKDNKTDQVDLLYEVSYSDGEKTITLDAKKDIDSITLTDLKADTEYTINIKVTDEAGNESSYETTTATTLPLTGVFMIDGVLVDISLYPNPTAGLVNIKADREIDRISVFNFSGQKMMELTPKSETFIVDLSELSPAPYYVRIEMDGRMKTFKLIKK